jgi:hypothetical protein
MKIKCIYCLKEKPTSEYKKREHIIPQLFGKFTPTNLILLKTVCDSCNTYFGNNLELFLGRDTYEGVLRYQYGIRSRKTKHKYSRLKFRISNGPLKGMLVKPKYSDLPGEIDIDPEQILQVGFFNKRKQEYNYFEPQDIPVSEKLEENGYDLKEEKSIRIVAKVYKEEKYLIDLLKSKGIESGSLGGKKRNEYKYKINEGDKIPVEIDAKIDRTIHRGLSKIAFNYLSYIAGNFFVLSDDFNDIRNFIRFDRGNSKDFMIPNILPILHDDKFFNIKTAEGHLITIGWRGLKIFSKLSLFNEVTWGIKLCDNFRGIWRPIKKGHFFDIRSKKVSELIGSSIAIS